MRSKRWKSRAVRFGIGIAISAVFVAVTLSRVDIRGVVHALQEVQPAGLAVARRLAHQLDLDCRVLLLPCRGVALAVRDGMLEAALA